ncbi:unnamed protein product [Danaus chrysippus]|uniref:(African queen) hypothetical protein n=1 Tax=Danaus chrysippus TaxID=151541 RepID=A0A8J2W8U0_9NEOP|nr:unnamed protein product [Danaus chrysippus]
MFGVIKYYIFTYISVLVLHVEKCISEPQTAYLALYSPGDTDYTDVLVRREHDNLTLVCEMRGDITPRVFVWNYVGDGNNTSSGRSFTPESTAAVGSRIEKFDLQLSDSGHYICSAPPFSVTKYILVQRRSPQCARGAFWCGHRCVLPTYVCDGWPDCERGEDEAPPMCAENPCAAPDKLNCSLGRCISEAACCSWRGGERALCRQPSCCDEHPKYSQDGLIEVEYPPLYEDRHAPDDYGFIQSTIYTVTACALIFMIAVVLLVSALCKMHMKRAALRGYEHAHRDARGYTARFPPRYEAARLMESSVAASPVRSLHLGSPTAGPSSPPGPAPSRALAALSAALCSRYRQVPTQCCEVEMRDITMPQTSVASTPQERPLTLQLGRFSFNIPRFRNERPDTPDITEINIEDLEFIRMPSNETYTLNGRTIRLFGGNFQNYPLINRPPPYNEAMRHKFGPPPEYLSHEVLNNDSDEDNSNIEMPPCYEDLASGLGTNYQPANENDSHLFDTTSLVNQETNSHETCLNELPVNINNNRDDTASYISVINSNVIENNNNLPVIDNIVDNVESISTVIDNLPAIDDVNANDSIYGEC